MQMPTKKLHKIKFSSLKKLLALHFMHGRTLRTFCLKHLSAHNPKIFFCLTKSLHLFETHVLTFFYVVKVKKSSHHMSHDQASKGHGSIPCLMSQTDLHRIKSL